MAKNAGKKKKTPKFRQARNENRLGMMAAMIAVVIMAVVVGINSISLRQKEKMYAQREAELIKLIELEDKRAKELEELGVYTKTKKYAEEVAKEKLGLVYENEIIFQEVE